MLHKHMITAALATLVFSGCADNPDVAAVPPAADPLASVPNAAQADAAGLVSYLEMLADNTSELREAIDLQTVMLTSREDAEPLALK